MKPAALLIVLESAHLCWMHSACPVIPLTGLLLKVWCKLPVPEELVKGVSSAKLAIPFIVQRVSVIIVSCMGKIICEL